MTSALLPETTAPAAGLADVDPDTGEVTAIVAVTGHRDEVGDILEPGCFARTIMDRRPAFCIGHDWGRPAGMTVSVRELLPGDPELPATTSDGTPWPREAGALVATGRYFNTTEGRDARTVARAYGPSQAYSIGYKVTEGGARHRAGTRHIDDLELFEWGPVLHGASRLATLQSVKAAAAPDGVETKAAAVSGTAIHAVVDPVDTATCTLCGREAMGAPSTGRPIAPGTVTLVCGHCLDRLDDLAYQREGVQESEGTAADLFTTSVTCGLCGNLAGGSIGGPVPDRDDVICPSCVAAMRELAADTAAVAAGDQPATTAENYDQALDDQRHLTMDAGANLVPDDSATDLGWSPAGSGRRHS